MSKKKPMINYTCMIVRVNFRRIKNKMYYKVRIKNTAC